MQPREFKAGKTDVGLVRSIIAESKPTDYDGHTEFSRMTPQQRLEWLDQAVLFIEAAQLSKQNASPNTTGHA